MSDIILSGAALAGLFPLFLVIALLIKLESQGPVFYRQDRLGRYGRTIRILKFRSMVDRSDRKPGESGELVGDDPEITRVGRMIRRLKIDELPQLISVLRGDMSFIGPRPCLPDKLDELDEYGRKRLEVRPGCSGLAQVNGNIYLPWSERWKYDAYYADHLTFWLDITIFSKTLWLIVRGEQHFVTPFHAFARRRPGGQ